MFKWIKRKFDKREEKIWAEDKAHNERIKSYIEQRHAIIEADKAMEESKRLIALEREKELQLELHRKRVMREMEEYREQRKREERQQRQQQRQQQQSYHNPANPISGHMGYVTTLEATPSHHGHIVVHDTFRDTSCDSSSSSSSNYDSGSSYSSSDSSSSSPSSCD